MDPQTSTAIANAAAQAVNAGFQFGSVAVQSKAQTDQAKINQYTTINTAGWGAYGAFGANNGFAQAISNKYAQPKSMFGDGSPNWVPWAAMAAVVVVLILIIRR